MRVTRAKCLKSKLSILILIISLINCLVTQAQIVSTDTIENEKEIEEFIISNSSKKLSFGIMSDLIHSQYGIMIGNGMDENPMLHFEDRTSDKLIFKIGASHSFIKDYSFEAKVGLERLFREIDKPSLSYTQRKYTLANFESRDLNLTFGVYALQIPFKFKVGYQDINSKESLGAGIGIENSLSLYQVFISRGADNSWYQYNLSRLYYGLMINYYTRNYLSYEAYIQKFIYRNHLSIKVSYENTNKMDFAILGVNYIFNR